ncbi:MAG: Gfo/Idh/MocA family oxidoreductase [Clostridia bacterium]|nr:Gfo/Idh/MocA family oxidoreductase [Clostridia bacterium]
MKSKVRILCVGIGGYATIYLKALLQEHPRDDVELVGMVEIMPAHCPMYGVLSDMGVPLYTTMEEFYEKNTADLAIITTPTYLHTRQILCALSHGSHVMCEKPLSGVSEDENILADAADRAGKFVMIGYQWSYSDAILALKRDVMQGVYGKPVFLKSMVLWPRPTSYYTRGSGWGGKKFTPDGEVLNDSVVSNATAHYLHNMLYVTGGAEGKAAEITELACDLSRINAIETYDTAAIRFTLDNGAKGLYIASHATARAVEPMFDYRFEHGTVSYRDEEKRIVGRTDDGREIDYGNPFCDVNEKIYIAIEAAKSEQPYTPPCGVRTAAPQVRAVEMLAQCPVKIGREDQIDKNIRPDGTTFLHLRGLDALLTECYEKEILPKETDLWQRMVQ